MTIACLATLSTAYIIAASLLGFPPFSRGQSAVPPTLPPEITVPLLSDYLDGKTIALTDKGGKAVGSIVLRKVTTTISSMRPGGPGVINAQLSSRVEGNAYTIDCTIDYIIVNGNDHYVHFGEFHSRGSISH